MSSDEPAAQNARAFSQLPTTPSPPFDPYAAFLANPDHEFWGAEAAAVTLVCPLAIFSRWFDEQPPAVQDSIASTTRRFFQHDPLSRHPRSSRQRPKRQRTDIRPFKAWLRRPSKDLEHTVARVGMLREAINLEVYRNRASRDDWAELLSWTVDRLAAARRVGDTAIEKICEKGLDEMPACAAAWMRSAVSWQQLCNTSLSQEALACWYEIATWQRN